MVTLFQASPVASRLPPARRTLQQLKKFSINSARSGQHTIATEATPDHRGVRISCAEDDKLATSRKASKSRFRIVTERWSQRAHDLASVRSLLKADDNDHTTYPELAWDAVVRRDSSLHIDEQRYIHKRRQIISSEGQDSLHAFLQLDAGETVHPDDVPLVAMGGSGGGYRAMYGFAAFISAAKKSRLWACTTWAAGVSGSCWTLAAYYTIAYQDAGRLIKHFLTTASESAHPMSVYALDTVARSRRGIFFLVGPLLRKAQAGIVGLGMMDLYATLTTSYLLLSREPRARLSRATFQFSKIWTRSGVSEGLEPMPIFTAVRVAPKDAIGVQSHSDSFLSKGVPPKRAVMQHQTSASQALAQRRNTPSETKEESSATVPESAGFPDVLGQPAAKGYYQWFEASPLEVGSADLQAYIPTWAWGRAFTSGHSVERRPEASLSLVLGQCTSAPAGPLTGYISALLASLPRGTVMSRILLVLNNFVRMKRWEHRWGNPIRAGDEPNPFYGLDVRPCGNSSRASRSSVLGIGIDILHMPRLDAIVDKHLQRSGVSRNDDLVARLIGMTKLANRILSAHELEEWHSLREDVLHRRAALPKTTEYLAVRWCAKEAAYKALYPSHIVSWKDLEVVKPAPPSRQPNATQKPVLRFSTKGLQRHTSARSVSLHLSVSHDAGYAIANVVAEQNTAADTDVEAKPNAQTYDWGQVHIPKPSTPDQGSLRPTASNPLHTAARRRSLHNHAWESQSRIRLMDAGMSNNLPNHILARAERGADVIIAFDASSDVQAGSAVRRIENFADDCHVDLVEQSHRFPPPSEGLAPAAALSLEAQEVERRFAHQYARVFQGTRMRDGSHFWLVYCPLLPNRVHPEYDPSTSSFSNSYNLVWTPAQVQTLLDTSEANLTDHALPVIKSVVRTVYEQKKARRLASQSSTPT